MKSHQETVSLIQQLWSVPAERVAALATFAKVVVKATTAIHGPDNSIGIPLARSCELIGAEIYEDFANPKKQPVFKWMFGETTNFSCNDFRVSQLKAHHFYIGWPSGLRWAYDFDRFSFRIG